MESTATLQIDAPSETVSLVDPRISRDGVPLCARHADATTPPMGWTMNDLRSRGRSLAAVPDEGTVPTSTPPRVRPVDEAAGRQMSKRQSIAERARVAAGDGQTIEDPAAQTDADESDEQSDYRFADSRPAGSAQAPVESEASSADDDQNGPSSRPTRRRDVADEEEPEEQFSFHFGFDDDEEPAELQASSPLLSRAFRATTG